MPLYRSSTRELRFDELPAQLAQALRDHAAQNQIALDRVRCWLTRSENPPSTSFFGKLLGRRSNSVDPDPVHDTAVVLHSTQLVIGRWGEKSGAAVLSLPLAQASIEESPLAQLGATASDPGMSIRGFPGEHGQPGSYFVKLGEDEGGAECRRTVESAIHAAKNR